MGQPSAPALTGLSQGEMVSFVSVFCLKSAKYSSSTYKGEFADGGIFDIGEIGQGHPSRRVHHLIA